MPRLEDRIRKARDHAAGSVRTNGVYERLIRRKRWGGVRQRAGAGALAIAVLAGTLFGISLLDRAFQPAAGGGLVAFTRFLEGCAAHPNVIGSRDVFAVDVATGEERRVSLDDRWPDGSIRFEEEPDFSPDGRTFVWVDHYRDDLYATDVATGETRRLTSGMSVAHPEYSPDGTQILFSSGGEGTPIAEDQLRDGFEFVEEDSGQIYVLRVDGGSPTFLTHGHLATWTADGRVAFARTSSTVHVESRGNGWALSSTPLPTTFFLMDADGSQVDQVYEFDGDVAVRDAEWSPDGSRLAAEVVMHGQADIYVLDLDTRIPHQVTDSPEDDTSPTWSPDGEFIAFHSGRWGDFKGHAEIAMVPADGGQTIRLTHDDCFEDTNPTWVADGAAVDSLPVWTIPPLPDLGTTGPAKPDDILVSAETDNVWDVIAVDPATGDVTKVTADLPDQLDPAWSPDHARITFASDAAEAGNLDIYVMDADGSNVTRLTSDPEGEARPSWSPDGAQLAYEGPGGIWVMNADGSNAHPVPGAEAGLYPSWSPDGRLIAFAAGEIMVVAPDGGGLRSVTSGEENATEVSWSPDGTQLLFTCVRDICVVDADGTDRRNLTAGPGDSYERGGDWSPDGSQIVFASDREGDDDMRLYVMDADGTHVRAIGGGGLGFCCPEPDW